MKRIGMALFTALLVLIGGIVYGYDRAEFLFLNEIEPGMTGVGRTVVAGDVIEEFAAEVLGVIDQPGWDGDFIVVRVSGQAIGRSGGIAQGMSGSPIYVEGKLVGALSRAAAWSKEITPIGLVTPIETMLGVIDDVRERAELSQAAQRAILEGVRLAEVSRAPDAAAIAASPDTIFSYPVGSPLVVTGLSGRSLETLMGGALLGARPDGLVSDFLSSSLPRGFGGLADYGLRLSPFSGWSGGEGGGLGDLESGSAMGVAVAMGDISIGALGTLTYREGETVVGFGHTFISNGSSAFPLTTASIYDTMKAYDASFKLGILGEPIGTILEDRVPGIGGVVGASAPLIDLRFSVFDADERYGENYAVDLIDESRLLGNLLLATGLEAIDTTLDRVGQGTVEITYQILGDGMPFPLERRDLFLSTVDVAVYPVWQLADVATFLEYNAFEDPQITRIAASIQITEELNAKRINHFEIDAAAYSPGDTIYYTVELQTFQGKKETIEGELVIPEDLLADFILVRVYGGPRMLEEGEDPREFGNLAELIEAVEDLPTYDTLTVELFAPHPLSPYPDALQGIDDVETEITGYFIYDTREAEALLLY